MLPPVSLPMEKPTNPAAVAAPGPALDPDAPSSNSHGFTVWPPNQMSLSASAPRLSLATSTAPASMQALHYNGILRGHTVAIRLGAVGGGDTGGIEQIFGAPRDAMQRAAVVSGGDLASACWACDSASSLVSVMTQRSLGLKLFSRSR